MKNVKGRRRMTKEKWTESIRNQIVVYLINYQKNRYLLQDRPYLIFEDMAVVFRIADQRDLLKERIVEQRDLEQWGIGIHELYQCALNNTLRLFPACVETTDGRSTGTDKEPVFIMSNEQGVYGAAVMLYPGFLKTFSEKYSWNLFLMPLSVHEIFVLLDRGQHASYLLHETAKMITSKFISKKDYLSDNIYYYDSNENQILTLY